MVMDILPATPAPVISADITTAPAALAVTVALVFSWEGVIVLDAKGSGGFGYDPYFYLPEYGCTSAELSADEKNRISHRGKALRLLLERLPR